MEYYFDGVIVVEGKQDVSYLSSFIDSNYICTNGYELKEDTIRFIETVSKNKKVIILTDPDEAGRSIRNKLNGLVKNLINIETDISCATRKKKSGVAETTKEEIIKKLKNYLETKDYKNTYINYSDLYILKGDLKDNVEKIREYYKLGKVNKKQFINRLNILQLDINKIKEDLFNGD